LCDVKQAEKNKQLADFTVSARKIFKARSLASSKKATLLGYQIDYPSGEKVGCSSQITIADRIFYVKLFASSPARFFSGDQKGVIQKEISKAEFEVWINILADSEADVAEIQKKLCVGKKY
jgi:hypothetical protein